MFSLLWNPKAHYRVHKSMSLDPRHDSDEFSPAPYISFLLHLVNFVITSTLGQTKQSSAVGIAIRLRAGRPGDRIPIRATNFPLLRSFHTGSRAHPDSHSTGTPVFPSRKATGA